MTALLLLSAQRLFSVQRLFGSEEYEAFAIFHHILVSQNYVRTLFPFSEISISSCFKLKRARNFKMEEVHFLQDKNEGTSASSSDANDI